MDKSLERKNCYKAFDSCRTITLCSRKRYDLIQKSAILDIRMSRNK